MFSSMRSKSKSFMNLKFQISTYSHSGKIPDLLNCLFTTIARPSLDEGENNFRRRLFSSFRSDRRERESFSLHT